jgi:predicted nucleic acid-binding protein
MILFVPWMPNPKGNPTFVLDAEVTIGWRVLQPRVWYPSSVLGRMTRSIAVVPECWFLHLAERVKGCVRSNQLTVPEAAQFFIDLRSFAIWVDDETLLRAWSNTFDLARTHNISTDDAAYLELALRMKLPLATIDIALTRAASAAGVPIFTP